MLTCLETMDLQKPLICSTVMGFSKPRAKMIRKPRSATLLNEVVSFFQPSEFLKEGKSLYSLDSLQGIYTEEDAAKTDQNLKVNPAVWFAKEEMISAEKNQLSGRQASLKKKDAQASGKVNNASKGLSKKGNEQSSSRRLHKSEDPIYPESSQAGATLIKNLDNKEYVGSMDEKGLELLNREASHEGLVREKPEKSVVEKAGSGKRGDKSTLIPEVQKGLHKGNRDRATEHQVEKCDQEVQLQVGRPTKLKLKVGGVTHTLQTFLPEQELDLKKSSNAPEQSKPESKKRRQRLILQGFSDDEDADIPYIEKFKERPTKQQQIDQTDTFLQRKVEGGGTYNNGDYFYEQMDPSICIGTNLSISPSALPVRKSLRVIKKRVFDVEEDGSLESEKKHTRKCKEDENDLYNYEDDEKVGSLEIDASTEADIDSLDDEEHASYKPVRKSKDQVGLKKRKVAPLTARQRALRSCKEHGIDVGTSWIEFPDGVPSSTQRKPKVRLSEEEIQAKRVEAARRRKQQSEKAARDLQASAIHKILTQDSVRKKREENLQKQREEIAQSKRAAELEAASNSIRWTYGPNGTSVSWSKDVELPTLFTSGPCSYPPPREKCAVATCNNTYKYRHSKLKLPLCSLQCYRMVETLNEVGSMC